MRDRIIEVLGRRGDELVTVGYVGPEGGPGYVQSAHRAATFTRVEAADLIETLRQECPGVILRSRPRPALTPARVALS